jgi:hypothetical protein
MERAMRRGIEHGLPSTQRLVYQAIAFRKYHKTGKCNPAAEQIMLDTGLSRSAVFHAIKALETKGLLIRKSTPDPVHPWRKASNDYHFPEEASANAGLGVEDGSARQADETSSPGTETSALGGQTSTPDTERRVHHMHGNKVLEKKDLREAFKKGENRAKSKPKGRSFLKSKSQNPKPRTQGSDPMDKLIADAMAKTDRHREEYDFEACKKRAQEQIASLMAKDKAEKAHAEQEAATARHAEYFGESGLPTQKLNDKLRERGLLQEPAIITESSVPF